ncbi:hypothetical protein C8T65DRAFT_784957, partial [Cerioporus squamosus]
IERHNDILPNLTLSLAIVVLIFDSFITFDQDVACFWNTKWTGASLLFFTNRWISITVYVMTLCGMTVDVRSCSSFGQATYAISILQFVPGAVFSALRAFVLSRSKPIGFIVLALSLVPVGANLVKYGQHLSGENFPPFGCLETDSISVALNFRTTVVIISRVPLIAADTLLIYITWTKLSSWAALRDIRTSKRLSLSDILFHGGTIYFIVLFALNVLHLAFTATASVIPQFTGPYVFYHPVTTCPHQFW